MKVEKLIEKLLKLDQKAEVKVSTNYGQDEGLIMEIRENFVENEVSLVSYDL